jgi:hypothetical protein
MLSAQRRHFATGRSGPVRVKLFYFGTERYKDCRRCPARRALTGERRPPLAPPSFSLFLFLKHTDGISMFHYHDY